MEVDSYPELKDGIHHHRFVRAYWCENPSCEQKIKEETKATTRVLTFDEEKRGIEGKCVYCGNKSTHRWLFALSY